MDNADIHILVVEDDERIARLLQVNLEATGYQVTLTNNGQQAIDLAALEQPDLILLDLKLPGKDGHVVCEEIRQFSQVPIIIITAHGQTDNLVHGLDAGADDFIPKPFSAQELLARIRAVLRRATIIPEPEKAVYEADGLSVDFARRRVHVDDQEISLTATEYHLLVELVRNAGKVVVPNYLLERIWETNDYEPHLVWQAVHRLRQKIERNPSNPEFIHTRPGIGYIFQVNRQDEVSDDTDS